MAALDRPHCSFDSHSHSHSVTAQYPDLHSALMSVVLILCGLAAAAAIVLAAGNPLA